MTHRPRSLAVAALTVAALAGLVGLAAPAATAQSSAYPPANCDGLLVLDTSGPAVVGDPVDATAYGFTRGEKVALSIGSAGVETALADSDGTAEFTAPIPSTVPRGEQTARAVGATSKCVQTASVDVVAPTSTALAIKPAHPAAYAPVTLVATVTSPDTVSGAVDFTVDGLPSASVTVTKGVARDELPAGLSPGNHELSAEFEQTDTESGSIASLTVTVPEVPSAATLTLSKHRIDYGASLSGTVRVPASDGGDALVTYGGQRVSVQIGSDHDGHFSIAGGALPAGKDVVTARYTGTKTVAPSATVRSSVRVAKATSTVTLATADKTIERGHRITVAFSVHGRRHGMHPGGTITLTAVSHGVTRQATAKIGPGDHGSIRLVLDRSGKTSLSLYYDGDVNYAAARSSTRVVQVS